MTRYRIAPSKVGGIAIAPPSKSQTMRAIFFASFAEGISVIENILDAPDTNRMITACRAFGAQIKRDGSTLSIDGCRPKNPGTIDAGGSGIILRFCTALTALTGGEVKGNHRPMDDLLLALPAFQKGEQIELRGEDSQPVSALIIAAILRKEPTEISVTSPGEKPWVDLTLHWLDRLGIPYKRDGYSFFRIYGGEYSAFTYHVPGDWSSASFPGAAALMTGGAITIEGLEEDLQGDRLLFTHLQTMGAKISFQPLAIAPSTYCGGTIDCNDLIDAVPILTALACRASGTTTLINAAVARGKECDRLRASAVEFQKMGAKIKEFEDGLVIQGGELQGAYVHSRGDHRMAMALAVAGFAAKGETIIDQCSCTSKTYPHFVSTLSNLGAKIEELP